MPDTKTSVRSGPVLGSRLVRVAARGDRTKYERPLKAASLPSHRSLPPRLRSQGAWTRAKCPLGKLLATSDFNGEATGSVLAEMLSR